MVAKVSNVFDIRRAPTSLHTANMHSNSLTESPVTHRATQNELSYKLRKLTERGEYEKAAVAEVEAATRDKDGRGGSETVEYRNIMIVMVLGYLTAHSVVYRWYYPDDVRFSYQPDVGYTEDVEGRREVLKRVDELVGFKVLDGVYDKRRDRYRTSLLPSV
jgi:hypothetical protein